jgi:putative SOS response-associated peptidase YedK
MCGRYTLSKFDHSHSGLAEALGLAGFEEFTERPQFNIAPSEAVAMVRVNEVGQTTLAMAHWGLIPHWAKKRPKVRPFNARAETLATSGMYKHAFLGRRCLIPADGFYEWKKLGAKTKQPMFIHFPDARMFCFAGLWDQWRPKDDAEPIDTCTIITTTPNKLISSIHDRMPVILKPEDYATWLDHETQPDQALMLLRPYPDDELEAIAVNPLPKQSGKPSAPLCETPRPSDRQYRLFDF